MKIEFIYGPFSSGNKKFSFGKNYDGSDKLLDSSQGLSGSEFSCFSYAKAMSEMGHEVSLYLPKSDDSDNNWDNVRIFKLEDFGQARIAPDVFYSWNEPDVLRYTPESSLRVVNQQLNDFNYCHSDFDQFVDIYTSPSRHHLEYIKQFTPSKNKWQVVSNGCDVSLHKPNTNKRSGSVIWCSSPDRGLHLLLQEWEKIKRAVPDANLRIFYNFDNWFNSLKDVNSHHSLIMQEFKKRADYIADALEKLKHLDITHYKSVSKNQICKEMDEAKVLGFLCDTPTYTEGFSCVSVEAMASGAFPVLSEQDALKQIYGSVSPMVKTPTSKYAEDGSDLIIKALKDKDYFNLVTEKTTQFAKQFDYKKMASELEKILLTGLLRKKNGQ